MKRMPDIKQFNELFNSYLDKKVTNEQIKEQMMQFGFKDEECTNKNAMVFAQYKEDTYYSKFFIKNHIISLKVLT